MKQRKKHRLLTIYLTQDQMQQMDELVAYYSQGAAQAGPSSIVRYAMDRLYQAVQAEKKEG